MSAVFALFRRALDNISLETHGIILIIADMAGREGSLILDV